MKFEELIQEIGHGVDFVGVLVIAGGIVIAGLMAVRDMRNPELGNHQRYQNARQRAGRGLVLGLEVLVAADIIQTVALVPSFTNIGVLALIVLVRTFLSWTLALDLDGRWPWQREKA